MKEHRQRLRSEDRQDEIIKAAIDLAGKQGVDNVTTQDMATAIGVTQGAIFRHFPTKEMIWIAVVHWVRGRLMSVVEKAARQGKDPLDSLERIFFTHVSFVEKYPAIPRLLFSTNPTLKQLLREIVEGYEAKIRDLLKQARIAGLVRIDLNEKNAAVLFTGMIQGLVMRVMILSLKKSMTDEAQKVFPIYLRGIGAVTTAGVKTDTRK